MEGRIHRTRPSMSTSAENSEEDKIDPPIHTVYFHTSEANTLRFIVDGDNARRFLCHALKKSLGTLSCHLTARHGVQLCADVNVALHVALERSVV